MTDPCVVQLSPAEIVIATTVGAMRHSEALHSGRRERHGSTSDQDGLSKHVLGACGELAVAKVLGLYWGGDVCTFKAPDVGGVQVRTRSRDDYDLIVRPGDADDEVFVLVTGSPTRLWVRGWIYGRDAKRPEFLQGYGGRPAVWFVPVDQLRPMFTTGAT